MQKQSMELRMDALPAIYRTVFVLCALEQVPLREVAEILGMSEASVRECHIGARRLLGKRIVANLEAVRRDAYSFDGERCERIVREVARRLAQPDT